MPTAARHRLHGLLAAAVMATTTGCSTPSAGSGDTGYITGDGVVTTVAAADRQDVPDVRGKGLDGAPIDLAAAKGSVVVVNVWAHWCPPCRAEAPALAAAARQLPDVTFIGIDTREDNVAAARAFVRAYHVPYDSIYDPDGTVVLAFYGMLSPNSLPSTLVIDKQGRIAALVRGEVDTTTLLGLVHDVSAGT